MYPDISSSSTTQTGTFGELVDFDFEEAWGFEEAKDFEEAKQFQALPKQNDEIDFDLSNVGECQSPMTRQPGTNCPISSEMKASRRRWWVQFFYRCILVFSPDSVPLTNSLTEKVNPTNLLHPSSSNSREQILTRSKSKVRFEVNPSKGFKYFFVIHFTKCFKLFSRTKFEVEHWYKSSDKFWESFVKLA